MKEQKNSDNEIKIIAFHLPQYHTFPENDQWWGEGFTEWVNVKKAEPLFKGHNQPRVPFDENYYNMLDVKTLKKQAELSSKYGVYGFCYYHYWFNGKMLMEKPVELLLEHKEIQQKFCFCWANEPWTRSWDGNSGVVLMPQEYGLEPEWEEHFIYLLDFFRDERYIKIDEKPLFVLYRTNSIANCDKMIRYFDMRAKQEGLKGLFVLEEKNAFQADRASSACQGAIEFEPLYTLKYARTFTEKLTQRVWSNYHNLIDGTHTRYYDYKKTWKALVRHARKSDESTYSCAFVDWDNTPRRGENGIVFRNTSSSIFENGMNKLLEVASRKEQKLLFINAWNEWAEGCYLEPDARNKYENLESLKRAVDRFSEKYYEHN